jgi:hypothetical protein
MSLLKTKPLWAQNAVATKFGWQDPVTKEVYVSIRGLDERLAAEQAINVEAPVVEVKKPMNPDFVAPVEVAAEPVEVVEIVEKKEIVMQETAPEVEVKVPAKRGRKPKALNEVVEQPAGLQVIGEVVEQPEGVQIIGE